MGDDSYFHRRSGRLQGYDYSRPGKYFVTIVAKDRQCLFGEINHGKMILNKAGRAVKNFWKEIPSHYPDVGLDAFVVMPNHVHGIIVIGNDAGRIVGAQNFVPLRNGPDL